MIPHIADIQGLPEIGRSYYVPSVRALSSIQTSFAGHWLPVMGPPHEDIEIIGFFARHWHIDWRFMSRRACLAFVGREPDDPIVFAKPICVDYTAGTVETRLRRCYRQMGEFPIKYKHPSGHLKDSPWSGQLENAYAGQRMKCQTCPHRGMPLDGLPVRDGVVICPGHGLAWNVETGELHRRVVP